MGRLTKLLITVHNEMTPIGVRYGEDWEAVYIDTPAALIDTVRRGTDNSLFLHPQEQWPEEAKQKLLLASIINYTSKEKN